MKVDIGTLGLDGGELGKLEELRREQGPARIVDGVVVFLALTGIRTACDVTYFIVLFASLLLEVLLLQCVIVRVELRLVLRVLLYRVCLLDHGRLELPLHDHRRGYCPDEKDDVEQASHISKIFDHALNHSLIDPICHVSFQPHLVERFWFLRVDCVLEAVLELKEGKLWKPEGVLGNLPRAVLED